MNSIENLNDVLGKTMSCTGCSAECLLGLIGS